jgi:Rab-GTPase-TBC domain
MKMMQDDEEDVMDEISLVVPLPCSPTATTNPSCRSIRWGKQLLGLGYGQLQKNSVPLLNSFCDIEALLVLHFEKLQEQYSSLLGLLDVFDYPEFKIQEPQENKINEMLSSLDPLSAMVQEDDARINRQKEIAQLYERDRKQNRGRRGPYIPDEPQNSHATENAIAYKQLIRKDLLRLSSPHQQVPLETNDDVSSTSRLDKLTSLLFLFAISHPQAGYLQGMHEIASYCLYALEIDDESLFQQRHVAFTAALSYFLTESIISQLYIAYDVTTVPPTEDTSYIKTVNPPYQTAPLVQMSNRIFQSVLLVDATLYSILQTSSQAIPFQLIFTKWIRLLFSREVVACPTTTHANTVILLWDALFDAAHSLSHHDSSSNMNAPLQTIAEIFSVARLWHHSNAIQHLHYSSRTTDTNFLLHWLMNIPPEPMDEVRKILQRMNYIISLQFNMNDSSDAIKAKQVLLPPLNAVPPDILAMTSSSISRNHKRDALQKQSTPQSSHYLWDGSSIGASSSFLQAAAAALSQKDHSKKLSSLTETIASKTQSIQRLIVQEWENVQAQMIDNPMYDCGGDATACDDAPRLLPTQQKKQEQEQSKYNLAYYSSTNLNSTERGGPQDGKAKWSEQLQRNVTTIHHYVVEKEQKIQNQADTDSQNKRLIWDALTELQSLQQELNRRGL